METAGLASCPDVQESPVLHDLPVRMHYLLYMCAPAALVAAMSELLVLIQLWEDPSSPSGAEHALWHHYIAAMEVSKNLSTSDLESAKSDHARALLVKPGRSKTLQDMSMVQTMAARRP